MSRAREASFFKNFRNSILALDSDTLEECELRVNFQVSSFDMIPRSQHEIIFNLTRSFPTPPVYEWLVLGIAGTNISRFMLSPGLVVILICGSALVLFII